MMDTKRIANCLRELAAAIDESESTSRQEMVIQKNDEAEAVIVRHENGKLSGVDAAAKRLGCSKGHLWMVVKGVRQSKRLMKRVRIHDIQITQTK